MAHSNPPGYISPSRRSACSRCGKTVSINASSLPPDRLVCLSCRRAANQSKPSRAKSGCRMCGGPLASKRAYYCDVCRPLAVIQRRRESSERFMRWAAENGPTPNRDRKRASTAERGYGVEHQRIRKGWTPKVAAGGVCCARCGGRIEPGSHWNLGHDPSDRSRYWGPEHRRCNMGWRRIGGPEELKPRSDPYKPKKTTTERGLGADHQKRRRRLLLSAFGTDCPLCGELMAPGQDLDMDHVIPRSLGGANGPTRIVHRSCNRSAGARLGNRLRSGSSEGWHSKVW